MFSKILFWYSFSFHISLWASFHVFMAIQISSVKNLLTFFLPNFKLSCVVILSFKMFLYILEYTSEECFSDALSISYHQNNGQHPIQFFLASCTASLCLIWLPSCNLCLKQIQSESKRYICQSRPSSYPSPTTPASNHKFVFYNL